MGDKIIHQSEDIEECKDEINQLKEAELQSGKRLDANPDNVQSGVAKLVLTVVKLVKSLLERQAVRRMQGGKLTEEEIERMGKTFMELEETLEKLKEEFDLEDEDLNLDLGPLGDLM